MFHAVGDLLHAGRAVKDFKADTAPSVEALGPLFEYLIMYKAIQLVIEGNLLASLFLAIRCLACKVVSVDLIRGEASFPILFEIVEFVGVSVLNLAGESFPVVGRKLFLDL